MVSGSTLAAKPECSERAQHNRRRRTGLSVLCVVLRDRSTSGSLVEAGRCRSHRRRNRIAPRQGLSVGVLQRRAGDDVQCSSCGSEHGSHPSQFPLHPDCRRRSGAGVGRPPREIDLPATPCDSDVCSLPVRSPACEIRHSVSLKRKFHRPGGESASRQTKVADLPPTRP